METLNLKTKRVKRSKCESSVDFREDILFNRNMQETMIVIPRSITLIQYALEPMHIELFYKAL